MAETTDSPETATAPPVRLALVDDHPIVVAGLQALLASASEVSLETTAASLQELEESFPSHHDVVFLDLNIPGENYRDNIKAIKTKSPRTHIIAYTSYNYPELVSETLSLGCSGYVLKQIAREQIPEAIRTVVAGDTYVGTQFAMARSERGRRKSGNGELRDDFQKRLLLSKREKEILNLISKGFTSQHIAEELFISRYTVETHRKNILRKLNFNTSTELVKFAVMQGLV